MWTVLFTVIQWSAFILNASASSSIQSNEIIKQVPLRVEFAKAQNATVLVFLSARCPCSASHESSLKELFERFSGQGFQFIGIHSNQNEPLSEAKLYFEKALLPFPVLDDPGARLANEFGAIKTPHVYIINQLGKTIFQGGVDDSHKAMQPEHRFLERAILQILANQKPDPSEVRTLGCLIKR